MTPATSQDLPHALDWLADHGKGPIFLESNLRQVGLACDSDASLAVHLWQNARAMAGLTRAGVLMLQMQGATDADWTALGACLARHAVNGLMAEAAQVRRAQQDLGLADAEVQLARDEPAFALRLDDLVMPDTTGLDLRDITAEDLDLLTRWRADYCVETIGDDPETAVAQARGVVEGWCATGSHKVLWSDGKPVAVTGFNAQIPDLVQIGGVYTPPDLRGRGFAPAALALHLDRARRAGISRAYLFAGSDRAARSYARLGFQRAGTVAVVFHAAPKLVTP